jgi:prepilin-type N-terminal cleavage/methylation domain-containing protein
MNRITPTTAAARSTPGNLQASRGFTLIELLVVIAIIAILAAILFPVFAQARAEAREQDAQEHLGDLSKCLAMYIDEHGSPPASIVDLVSMKKQDGYLIDADGLAVLDGYLFDLMVADDAGVLLVAEPAVPGITGGKTFFEDASGDIESMPTPGAEKAYDDLLRRLRQAALREVAAVVYAESDEEDEPVTDIKPFLRDEETVLVVFDTFDLDDDGRITAAELCLHAEDDGPLGPAIAALCDELRLGAGNEGTHDLPAVTLDDLKGDPAGLFSYENLCELTADSVWQEGVAEALCRKLLVAQRAEARGRLRVERGVLRAYARHAAAQAGESISEEDAATLIILSEIIRPREPEQDNAPSH